MTEGGGFDPNDAKIPSEGEENKPVKTDDSLVPVTIRQLLNSIEQDKSDPPIIDGLPRKHIALVGMITDIAEENISLSYTIDDGTGQFKVQDYTHTDNENNLNVPFEINSYVYVVGRFKRETSDNSSPAIVSAFAVKPVTDPNQIAFHILQALYVHLFATRGLPQNSAFEKTVSNNASSNASSHNATIGGASNQSNNNQMPDTEILKEAIKSFIRSKDQTYGVNIKEIRRALLGSYSVEAIDAAVEDLAYSGEIYSAVEPETYSIC